MRELFEIQAAFHKFGVSKEHRKTIEKLAIQVFDEEMLSVYGDEILNELISKKNS